MGAPAWLQAHYDKPRAIQPIDDAAWRKLFNEPDIPAAPISLAQASTGKPSQPLATPAIPTSADVAPTQNIQVQMPDGSSRVFNSIDESLNQALHQGGKVIVNGQPIAPQQFQGGWLVNGQPLNVLLGQPLLPEQQAVMQTPEYLSLGQAASSASGIPPTGPAQPIPPAPAIPSTSGGSSGMPVRMKDGIIRYFNSLDPKDPNALELDQILKSGSGVPLDLWGEPMKVTDGVYGGYLVTDSKGQAMPLNVAMGNGWLPGQQETLTSYQAAGWTPGSPALPPDKTPPIQNNGQPIDPNSRIPEVIGGFGALTQPYLKPFTGESVLPARSFNETFNYDINNLLNSPAYKFRMSEGIKALSRGQSAAGNLFSGGALKEAEAFGQDLASTEFERDYGRSKSEFDTRKSIFDTNEANRIAAYDRGTREYQMDHDITKGNQNDIFNKLNVLAGGGQTSSQSLLGANSNYGTNAGNITMAQAAANAGGVLGKANANVNAAGNIGMSASDILLLKSQGLL